MKFALWQATFLLGMGVQAAISAALFPNGIDPDQQLRAAFIFGTLALATILVGLAVSGRGRREHR